MSLLRARGSAPTKSSARSARVAWAGLSRQDTRLGRDVAVKILPAHLSQKPEVRERFEREARVISSLNHPHICTLYDVDAKGTSTIS